MKIVIIGPAYPYRGGIAAFNERLARQFSAEGHDVEIFTFSLQYPSFLFPGKTQFSTEERPSDLKITRSLNSVNPFSWIKTVRMIKNVNPDLVVFAHWMPFFAPCYGVIARKLRGVKKIGLIHNMIPHEKSAFDKILSFYFVKSVDSFVALSKSVLDDVAMLDKQDKPKIFVPHPIYDHYGPKEGREEALQNLGLSTDSRYILFFGLVRAYKGLDLLISAMADERLKKYNVKLLVAGEFYDDEKVYIDKINSLKLNNCVIIDNKFIPDVKVKDYFNAADIIAQPYRTATQSGVTQVGFHFEKAMLVTDVGGLKEIIHDGKFGYVVQPEAEKIADALVDFFENKRKSFFESRVAEEKKKYSWDRITAAIIKVGWKGERA